MRNLCPSLSVKPLSAYSKDLSTVLQSVIVLGANALASCAKKEFKPK